MTDEQLPRISVIEPVGPAIERVKAILFRPFDLGKWFVIGFFAWLAHFGQGGFNFNFNYLGRGNRNVCPALNQIKDVLAQNAYWLVPLIIFGFVLGMVLLVILTWLSSRGRFMFLHCVAANRAEVKVPWHKFREQGNSLFLFRLVAGLVSFICLALLVGLSSVLIFLYIKGQAQTIVFVIALIFLVPVITVLGIAVAVLFKFTYDFVVPIMFLRGTSCADGWRQFLAILSANKGRFTLYIFFQIVIALALGAIIFAAVCITCCCAGCILAIPYIGTVLMLPLLVFKRAYSLLYLRQYGPEFDVFIPEAIAQ